MPDVVAADHGGGVGQPVRMLVVRRLEQHDRRQDRAGGQDHDVAAEGLRAAVRHRRDHPGDSTSGRVGDQPLHRGPGQQGEVGIRGQRGPTTAHSASALAPTRHGGRHPIAADVA